MRLNWGLSAIALYAALVLPGCGSKEATNSATSTAATTTSAPPPAVSTAVWKDGTKAGEERNDNGPQIALLWCPAGKFQMGSPTNERGRRADEGPVEVTLSH